MSIRQRLSNGFRALHRWLGLGVVILTVVWVVEAIALPPILGAGSPTIDNRLPMSTVADEVPTFSLQQATQVLLNHHLEGIDSVNKIDAITYFPNQNIYQFKNQTRYFEGYINAQTGELLKYGFNAEDFLAQQGFLKWLHPWLGSLVQSISFLLTLILLISGFYLFLTPFRTKKARRNKP
ncbi:MAG TPA: hypothetical protein ACFE0H_14960 [Elainellaceae cyanobacterium]